jgi:hypothetical protein
LSEERDSGTVRRPSAGTNLGEVLGCVIEPRSEGNPLGQGTVRRAADRAGVGDLFNRCIVRYDAALQVRRAD